MFLFHEIYPRNFKPDWDIVGRAVSPSALHPDYIATWANTLALVQVGREAAECETKTPTLVAELETFLSKYSTLLQSFHRMDR